MTYFYRRCTRVLSWILLWVFVFLGAFPMTSFAAPAWPDNVYIQAEGGIVMDADSGTVLFGKNIHEHYYPASITKILTALIVIENCDLDEMVTFSYDAIFNVEENSSNMAASVGDTLTVRDCLYGLMLASANESANALAEHVAGSTEAFAELMNQKAAELGCQDSHFANPSGLNAPNHYTSAYDMALIMQAALQNETFVEIDSALYYKHAPIKQYPDPEDPHNVVYAHHQMLKKNSSVYYPGAFAGKTGYTSLAGNTLVTAAKKDSMTLITVVLNGSQVHYSDTKRMLDFGFENFQTLKVADYDHTYTSIENDMSIAGLTTSDISVLSLDDRCYVTLPKGADISDAQAVLNYDLGETDPDDAIAQIQYTYNDRSIGSTYLTIKGIPARQNYDVLDSMASVDSEHVPVETIPPEETAIVSDRSESESFPLPDAVSIPDEGNLGAVPDDPALSDTRMTVPENASEKKGFFSGFHFPEIPPAFWIGLAALLAVGGLTGAAVIARNHFRQKAARERQLRRERRIQRLKDIGCSESEFDIIMEERKRSSYTVKHRPHNHRRKHHFR